MQDYVEAVKRYHESAEAGYEPEQCGHCAMYTKGEGVARGFEQDHAAAFWLQVATVQGNENALNILDLVQQHRTIPTPLRSTAIITILLTSA